MMHRGYMLSIALVVLIIVIILILIFMRSQSNMCPSGKTTINWGGEDICFAKGSYSDTSHTFWKPKTCQVSGPNNVQAYWSKNFDQPAWSQTANQTTTVSNCWPFSLKVTK
jgi:hypothetical protein